MLAHRHFHLLAGQGVRDAVHLIDLVRNVARRILAAQRRADPLRAAGSSSALPFLSFTNSGMKNLPPRQVQVDDQRVLHLRQRRERAVDLRRADAHAVAVERRIRAAQHEAAAALVDPEEIPVAPDARVLLEIGLRGSACRPGRSRSTPASRASARSSTSSPTCVHDLLAALVECVHRAPRARAPGSRPAYTGRVGTPPTKPVQTSVPPLPEATHRSCFTFS